jgi:4-hydroxy-2-oxoheptanedioate aldolase
MKNIVKEKLKNNEKVMGTFLVTSSTYGVESLGNTDIDYVIIDTEHGPYDTETMADLIRAAENVNLTPFVRISDINHKEIQRAVDLGAQGLIVPLVRTMEQIQQLVNYAKFSPIGNRGFAPTRSNKFGHHENFANGIEDFMKISNENVMVIPQCETVECLEIIEDIIDVDGIDGIFIGPYDLSISLGIPLQFDNPVYHQALERIQKACKAKDKPSFIFSGDLEVSIELLNKGFDSIAYNLDTDMLAKAYNNDLKIIQKSFKN